jgi:hypothetical protein
MIVESCPQFTSVICNKPEGRLLSRFRARSRPQKREARSCKLETVNTLDFQRTLRGNEIGLNITFEVLFWRFLLSNWKGSSTSIDYRRKCAPMRCISCSETLVFSMNIQAILGLSKWLNWTTWQCRVIRRSETIVLKKTRLYSALKGFVGARVIR